MSFSLKTSSITPGVMVMKSKSSLRRGRVSSSSKKSFAVKASGDTVVSIDELTETTRKAIKTYGYDEKATECILDILMYAQLRGNNQGIIKVTTNGIARDPEATPIKITEPVPLSAAIDGGNNHGMIVLDKAAEIAIEKCKKHGVGIVGTNHTFTSTGALGYYAKKIGEQGMVGIVLAQSPEFVAPAGAKQAIFGTNPIGCSIPRKGGEPMTLDMATSAYAFFGLLEAKTSGKPLPPNVAQDKDGNMTTDANAALDGGAIMTFDCGYKSSNLSLCIELLAGPLVGAAYNDKKAAKNWGNLVFAIDPKILGNDDFLEQSAFVMERVKNAERKEGVSSINLPGERGDALAAENKKKGTIGVEPNLWKGLQEYAAKYDPKAEVFPIEWA